MHLNTIWKYTAELCVSSFSCTDKVFYALNEDKVCRGIALMLLQNAVKFNLREFQEVWQQSVPEGMSTRLEQLKVSLHLSWAVFWYLSREGGVELTIFSVFYILYIFFYTFSAPSSESLKEKRWLFTENLNTLNK